MTKRGLISVSTILQLAVVVAVLSVTASASTIPFSGSGSSGVLSAPSETWVFNYDGGAAATGYLNNWGSPGVGAGEVTSGETVDLYGMDLTFTGGGPIDAASIAVGNASACAGSTTGGTTFCTDNPADIWVATLVGPDTIAFRAQNPTFYLTPGQLYFVNVFFDGATPTGFTGDWLTTYSPTVPEPATFSMLGLGLAGLLGSGLKRLFPRLT